jgi:hypothetical protein
MLRAIPLGCQRRGGVRAAHFYPDFLVNNEHPSTASSSNLLGDMAMYIAASSRERPRHGTGRMSDRVRAVMAPSGKPTYQGDAGFIPGPKVILRPLS